MAGFTFDERYFRLYKGSLNSAEVANFLQAPLRDTRRRASSLGGRGRKSEFPLRVV